MLKASGRTLTIVAHQDDGLLFLSPHLLQVLQAGYAVRTIFLTDGDNGADAHYWQERERGIQAAYAQMCSSANVWRQEDAGIAQHPIPLYILSGYPHVSLAFSISQMGIWMVPDLLQHTTPACNSSGQA